MARKAAQPELPVAEERETKPCIMLRYDQEIAGLDVQFLWQRGTHHRQQINAGDRQTARQHGLQPLIDDFGIGERREQIAVVAALAGIAAEQPRGHVGGVAVMLPQLAAHHLAAVRAERVRQRLEPVVLFDRVHHQGGGHVLARREVFAEGRMAALVVVEYLAFGDAVAAPARDGRSLRRNSNQEFLRHSASVNGKG